MRQTLAASVAPHALRKILASFARLAGQPRNPILFCMNDLIEISDTDYCPMGGGAS
jgi:hypothetical protein